MVLLVLNVFMMVGCANVSNINAQFSSKNTSITEQANETKRIKRLKRQPRKPVPLQKRPGMLIFTQMAREKMIFMQSHKTQLKLLLLLKQAMYITQGMFII